jgi:membrane-bound lytic murein transglycosylase D
MSFKQVADLLDVPVAQLQLLNPSYKLNIILLQRRESLFEITDGKIAAFVSNEDKMYAYVQHELDLKENPFQNSRAVVKSDENSSETRTTTRSATKYYKVKRGDNLGLIANKYDVALPKSRNGLRAILSLMGKV